MEESGGVQSSFDLDLGFTIDVTMDNLSANLIVRPAWLVGRELVPADIFYTLERFNIHPDRVDSGSIEGILNQIRSIVQSRTKLGEERVFPIARGIAPIPGIDGWIRFNFPRAQKVKIKEDGSADYRNIDRYIPAKKDQHLATLFEGASGKAGIDVFGKPIPPKPFYRAYLKAGNNIRQERDTNPENPLTYITKFFSTANGVIHSTENFISVSQELNIESDVGLETGNINYEGTIRVHGSIKEGSKVICKGSLFVIGNIESSDIQVMENLDIKGGIKCKDKSKGLIYVGGDMNAKFIENSSIEVEGDLVVESNILNSNIKCLGSVYLSSDSGSIVSSDIIAFKGISTANLGSSGELDTKVEVGFHYKNDRLYQEGKTKLANYEKETQEIAQKVLQIKQIVQRSRGNLDERRKQEFKEIFEDYMKRKKIINLYSEKLNNLKNARFNNENVKVVVRNQAYPGSIIRYRKQIEKFTTIQTSFMMSFYPSQEKAIPVAWKKESN